MVIIVLGVSGSGKTTVGALLARELNWKFYEGDDYHPEANKERMSEGIPLNDADRAPWLAAIRDLILKSLARSEDAVISCSALKQSYRDYLKLDGVKFVYLKGDYELIATRVRKRKGHFFDPELLASQFQTLEEPRDALAVDIAKSPQAIVSEIRKRLDLSGNR
jgi:gluconokinase